MGVAIVLVLMLIITVAVRNHYMVSFINKKAADSQDVLDAESESKIKELDRSICIIIKTPTRRI